MRRSITRRAVTSLPKPKQLPEKYNGPDFATVSEWRAKYQAPMHKAFYQSPIMLVAGKNQYLWDSTGKQYLDMYGGVSSISVGHADDKCVAAVVEQAKRLQHSTPLYHEPATYELMNEIAQYLPKGEDWVFHMACTGSEANDFAQYVARAYTGHHHMVCVDNGYHGLSEGSRPLIGHLNWKCNVPPAVHTIRTLNPNSYRGVFEDGNIDKYISVLEGQIAAEGNRVAGFIAERIQGVGGIYPLPEGYLPRVYDLVRARGGVCISDEVQCGFMRLGGKEFWGFELDGVVPDIITTAKSCSNGLPLGLVIMKRKIAEAITSSFFNTFGGNPLVCAYATAALRTLKEENYAAHNEKIGNELVNGLRALQKKYPVIGDVRGRGFMVAAELVTDKNQPMPVADFNKVHEALRERGLLVGRGGRGNVMRLQGPYSTTSEDIEYFLYALEESIKEVY